MQEHTCSINSLVSPIWAADIKWTTSHHAKEAQQVLQLWQSKVVLLTYCKSDRPSAKRLVITVLCITGSEKIRRNFTVDDALAAFATF